jgi:hypothetical protein
MTRALKGDWGLKRYGRLLMRDASRAKADSAQGGHPQLSGRIVARDWVAPFHAPLILPGSFYQVSHVRAMWEVDCAGPRCRASRHFVP